MEASIKITLDKSVLATARGCAFEALRAARRAHDLTAEIVEVAIELGAMPAAMAVAIIAAQQAQEAAELAELASVDSRVQQPYVQARRQYQAALRHEQSCALALRRFSAQVPDYARVRARIEAQKSAMRERLRSTLHPSDSDPMGHSVEVLGDIPPFGLRKEFHRDSVVKHHANEGPPP